MKIPITRNDDPFLHERIALKRGERLDRDRVREKIAAGHEPPLVIREYLAQEYLFPTQGAPRKTWRKKSDDHLLRMAVTWECDWLCAGGMTREAALKWLAQHRTLKGNVKSWRTWESYLLPRE